MSKQTQRQLQHQHQRPIVTLDCNGNEMMAEKLFNNNDSPIIDDLIQKVKRLEVSSDSLESMFEEYMEKKRRSFIR